MKGVTVTQQAWLDRILSQPSAVKDSGGSWWIGIPRAGWNRAIQGQTDRLRRSRLAITIGDFAGSRKDS